MTPEMIAFSSTASSSSPIHVPSPSDERRADAELDTVAARDLDRAQRHHLRARGGHLEHLLVGHRVELAARSGTIRGSAVKTPATSVKISQASAPRAAASATAVVSEPPRPSVVTSCVASRRPGSRRRARSCPPSGPSWIRCARTSTIFAFVCVAVGDDPRLRAGERDRLVAEVVDRHRAERVRDPLAGRDEHVVLARVRLRRDLVGERGSARPSCCPSRTAPRRPSPRLAGRDKPLRDALQLARCRRPTCRRTSSRSGPGCGGCACRRRGTASKSVVVILRQCRQRCGTVSGHFGCGSSLLFGRDRHLPGPVGDLARRDPAPGPHDRPLGRRLDGLRRRAGTRLRPDGAGRLAAVAVGRRARGDDGHAARSPTRGSTSSSRATRTTSGRPSCWPCSPSSRSQASASGSPIEPSRSSRMARSTRRYISRRPVSARPRVTSSAYSRSPPTGSPLARRVTRTRPRSRSAT